jgi:hypothetical protein
MKKKNKMQKKKWKKEIASGKKTNSRKINLNITISIIL